MDGNGGDYLIVPAGRIPASIDSIKNEVIL